jgi:hypothetical protein
MPHGPIIVQFTPTFSHPGLHFMSTILHDVAMGQVRACTRRLLDFETVQAISAGFRDVIAGRPSDHLALTLLAAIGTTVPLDRVLAVLQVPEVSPTAGPRLPDFDDDAPNARQKPRQWSQAEDNRLIAAVHRLGPESWWSIAQFVGGGRTRAQCAQRWFRGLDPRLSREDWSFAEEEQLLTLVAEHGSKKWTTIASQIGNRSDVQCRYHFLQLQKAGIIQRDMSAGGNGETWRRVISPIQATLMGRGGAKQRLAKLRQLAMGGKPQKMRPVETPPIVPEAAEEMPWVSEAQRPDDSGLLLGPCMEQDSFMTGIEPMQWF